MKADQELLEELKISKDKYAFVAERIVEFLTLILKHGHFKPITLWMPCKRLIRVHKPIPQGHMNTMGKEYLILSGLYIVADVMYLDPTVCKKFIRQPTEHNKRKLGLPSMVDYSTIRFLNDGAAVALCDSFLLGQYVQCASHWSYPEIASLGRGVSL
jgi:hypothetical protein